MPKGKNSVLRPVEKRDLDLIVRWRNDPRVLHTFFTPFLIHPAGQSKWFDNLQNDPYRMIFMIDLVDGTTVGMVGIDNIDRRNQQCENGYLLFDPDAPRGMWMYESILMLMEYEFKELNMRRVYSITYGDKFQGDWFEWSGWKKEVVLRQSVFMGGKFHDKVIWGVFREDWFTTMYGGSPPGEFGPLPDRGRGG